MLPARSSDTIGLKQCKFIHGTRAVWESKKKRARWCARVGPKNGTFCVYTSGCLPCLAVKFVKAYSSASRFLISQNGVLVDSLKRMRRRNVSRNVAHFLIIHNATAWESWRRAYRCWVRLKVLVEGQWSASGVMWCEVILVKNFGFEGFWWENLKKS